MTAPSTSPKPIWETQPASQLQPDAETELRLTARARCPRCDSQVSWLNDGDGAWFTPSHRKPVMAADTSVTSSTSTTFHDPWSQVDFWFPCPGAWVWLP